MARNDQNDDPDDEETPPNKADVKSDDALIDDLAAGGVGNDERLSQMLGNWVKDVDDDESGK